MGEQASFFPELAGDPTHVRLARLNLRASSIQRYGQACRSWERYCFDRSVDPANAPTSVLLRWLDARCADSNSPKSRIRVSLAGATCAQQLALLDDPDLECCPYNTRARPALKRFKGALMLNQGEERQACPLRLNELGSVLTRVVSTISPRNGVTYARAGKLANRDLAMLAIGWWGALRADDIANLEWSHIRERHEGIELHIPDDKTKQKTVLALARQPMAPWSCPVDAYAVLARQRTSKRGRVFELGCGNSVGRRVGWVFRYLGLPRDYTSHSLRAGIATEAAALGIPDKLMQAHGRWRSAEQHAKYVRSGRVWIDSPTTHFAQILSAQPRLAMPAAIEARSGHGTDTTSNQRSAPETDPE